MIKFVYASDNHGDKVDPEAAEALFEFCKDYQPDERIHGGDCFDFRALRKGASERETGQSMKEDLLRGIWFLKRFKPTVYLWGNHEHRLETVAEATSSEAVREYCESLKRQINMAAKQHGARKIYPYTLSKGKHVIGPVTFIHSFKHGLQATKDNGLFYCSSGGGLIHGHTHNLSMVSLEKDGGGAAYSAGCMCSIPDMHYAETRTSTAKWGNGWVAGWVDGKNWKAWHVHRVGTKWYWATDIKVWEPKQKTHAK